MKSKSIKSFKKILEVTKDQVANNNEYNAKKILSEYKNMQG